MTTETNQPKGKMSYWHIRNLIKKILLLDMLNSLTHNFMFTITFTECMRNKIIDQYKAINFLLHRINRELYKTQYKTGKLYNVGYAFFEGDDNSNHLKRVPNRHCHMLLKSPKPCDVDTFKK